jgi:hypothetical protein
MGGIRQVVRVQPGHRVEVVVPELAEGDLVNVLVQRCDEQAATRPDSVIASIDSLPDGPRAFPTWEEYEQHLRQERVWRVWIHHLA